MTRGGRAASLLKVTCLWDGDQMRGGGRCPLAGVRAREESDRSDEATTMTTSLPTCLMRDHNQRLQEACADAEAPS